MKIIFTLTLALFFCLTAFAQSEEIESVAEQTGIGEISLARDDGSGQPGAAANSFSTNDIPIYCSVELKSAKAVTVKMNFVAVSATNKTIVTIAYKTNGTQNGVTFTASPNKIWTAGKYRVDILLDGKPAKSLEFEIRNSPAEIKTNKLIPPKAKAKMKQKPRKS